jgi:hypothetical protein
MAEKKKPNWDKWIGAATGALGRTSVLGGAGILGATAAKNYSENREAMRRAESSKYAESKKGKQVGSAGRESAVQARKSDKEIREKFKGDMVKVDPKTRRLKSPPRPLY